MKKKFLSLLVATFALFAGLSVVTPAQAGQSDPTEIAAAQLTYPRLSGIRHSSTHVCLEDNSWGSYYPGEMHTSANSWNGPADFAMTYRGPAVAGGIDTCENGDFAAGNIIEFALWPADQANSVSWCAYHVRPGYSFDSFRGFYVWTDKHTIFYNFARSGCYHSTATMADINSNIGVAVGFIEEGLATYYSVMNTSRWDIKYPTGNDLLRVNDRY